MMMMMMIMMRRNNSCPPLFWNMLCLRTLWQNAATWPKMNIAEAFPDKTKPVCCSCRSFYVEGQALLLVPDRGLGVGDAPTPNPELTKALCLPVINLSIIKYVSLLNGQKSCEEHGCLSEAMWLFNMFIFYMGTLFIKPIQEFLQCDPFCRLPSWHGK